MNVLDDPYQPVSLETWVLTFYVLFSTPFVGGEYQTEERCIQGAQMQWSYWHHQYGRRLRYECKKERL